MGFELRPELKQTRGVGLGEGVVLEKKMFLARRTRDTPRRGETEDGGVERNRSLMVPSPRD